MKITETRTEWRVESDTCEDEFGTDEQGAREWLAEVQRRVRDGEPYWEPAVLMRRVVTTTTTPWETATTPTPTPAPPAPESATDPSACVEGGGWA